MVFSVVRMLCWFVAAAAVFVWLCDTPLCCVWGWPNMVSYMNAVCVMCPFVALV